MSHQDITVEIVQSQITVLMQPGGSTSTRPLSFVQDSNKSTSYTKDFSENSITERIDYKWKSGTPVVKIGTTLGGEDIVSELTVSDNTSSVNLITFPFDADTTVYITISGGTVDIMWIYRTGYWT